MPFEKGKSGNPAGRPKGETTKLREALLDAAPDVIAKLIEGAKAGEPVAVKEFMARVLPTLKPEAQRVKLDLAEGTLMQRGEAVLALAAGGSIPIDVATEYIGNVARLVAVEQAGELKAQLELLMADRYKDLA